MAPETKPRSNQIPNESQETTGLPFVKKRQKSLLKNWNKNLPKSLNQEATIAECLDERKKITSV